MERPSLLDVVIAPLKWLEKSRGWGRLGLIVVYLLIASTVGILSWRELSLWRIPNIGDPFDMSKYGTIDMADADNAMIGYRQAIPLIKPRDYEKLEVGSKAWFVDDWPTADPVVRDWLDQNRPALEAFVRAADKPDALVVQPKEMAVDTSLDPVQSLREFSRLAALESSRLEAAGDMVGAWRIDRAMLRSSLHASRHGGLVQRMMGSTLMSKARITALAWTEDPRVTPEMLRKATLDVDECLKMQCPASEMFHFEYFVEMSALEHPELWRKLGLEQDPENSSTWYEQYPSFHRARRFFRHEPERSQRLLRLFIASQLAQCDRPRADRPKIVAPRLGIYDHDERTPPAVRAISPSELDIQILNSVLLGLIPSFQNIQVRIEGDRNNLEQLRLTMAERAFEREHGKPPKTYGDLLGPYLKTLPDGIKPTDLVNPVPG